MKLKRLLVSMFLLAQARPSNAQECLQQPISLDQLPAPPAWFQPPPSSTLVYKQTLQDPRWSGATLRTFPVFAQGPNSTDNDDGVVRIMAYNNSAIYVSFQARVDANATGAPDLMDSVNLGFTVGQSNGAHILSIVPDWTTPAPAHTSTQPHDVVAPVAIDRSYIHWFSTGDTTVNPIVWTENLQPVTGAAIPTWLHDLAMWRSSPGAKWAITFWIDLTDHNLNIQDALSMFWGMQINQGAPGTVVLGSNPVNLTPDPHGNYTIVPSSPAGWTAVSAVGTTCTQGATVDSSDIGIWNGLTLTSTVCVGGSCSGTNDFRVTARNFTPAGQVPEYALRARLRIAEWGSVVTTVANAAWRDIPYSFPPSANVAAATTTDFDQHGWSWSYSSCTGEATIDFTCHIGSGDTYCPKLSNPSDTSNMLLAEIVAPQGVATPISIPTALLSMAYTTLSTVQQGATISLKGLETGSGPQTERDVYLLSDDSNLPAAGDTPIQLNSQAMAFARTFAEHPEMPLSKGRPPGEPPACEPGHPKPQPSPVLERAEPKKGPPKKGEPRLPRGAKPFMVRKNDPILRLIEKPLMLTPSLDTSSLLSMSRNQILDEVWPTHRVRAYYDTGKTITTRGGTSRLLGPMVPFGYRFSHDGALYGFKTGIAGAKETPLEALPDHWSKLRIRDGESVRITETFAAEEQPKTIAPSTPPPTPCPECKIVHGENCNCAVPGRVAGGMLDVIGTLGSLAVLGARRRRRSRPSRS